MNLTSDDVKSVLADGASKFYFIILTADNGDIYGWKGNGFEIVISGQSFNSDFSSDFGGSGSVFGNGFMPFADKAAEKAFYQAQNSAKTLPFEAAHLSISGLPKFSGT